MPTSYGRTRTRIIPNLGKSNVILGKRFPAITVGGVPTGQYSSVPLQTQVFNFATGARFMKAQLTQDSVHPGPPYRSGGDFSSLKYDWCTPYNGVFGTGVFDRIDKTERYVGGFHPPMGAGDFCPNGVLDEFAFANNTTAWLLRTVANTNHPTMDGLGSKAWNSTKPKLQKSGVFIFTAELRDMPRMLKQTSKRFHDIWRLMGGTWTNKRAVVQYGASQMRPKKVADDFLSQQFGWKPFLNDLQQFNTVVTEYHDILAKLQERNDRWVRRRVTLQNDRIISPIASGLGNKCSPVLFNANYFASPPTFAVWEVKETFMSAVGKFRYYRPEFAIGEKDQVSKWQSAMQMLTVSGARITPSNVYKAVPWTWLIDWFSNVGDYVDHLNDVWIDQIVNQYCFVMRHQRRIREFHQELPFASGGRALIFSREIDSKQRIQGTSPYGFDLSWDSLTPKQLAILAALGISGNKIAR